MAKFTTSAPIAYYQLISDIHLDAEGNSDFVMPTTGEESKTLLFAPGDLSNKTQRQLSLDWLTRHAARYAAIAVVLGNHDYWKASIEREVNHWRAHLPANVFVLSRDSLYIAAQDTWIHGATLWTDANKRNPTLRYDLHQKNGYNQPRYPDLHYIRKQSYAHKLGYDGILAEHAKDKQFLLDALTASAAEQGMGAGSPAQKHILMTHHSPFIAQGIPEKYRNEPDIYWWCCQDMECIFDCDHQPVLWLHGHTHTALDYQANQTRVRCNPRGRATETTGCDLYSLTEWP